MGFHSRTSLMLAVSAPLCLAPVSLPANSPLITYYRLATPLPKARDIEQGSDLCYGKLANRDGLWVACDRNGGNTGGRIYRFSRATLEAAKPTGTIIADEEIIITSPAEGWATFRETHRQLGQKVLEHIEQRIAAGNHHTDGKPLDLEAITIGKSFRSSGESRLFVVAEEPYSLILELNLGPVDTPTQAELVAAYQYRERDNEYGTDRNDGLEGLAYAGSPGQFWWAEEGTQLHKPDAHPRLFFRNPRVGLGELRDCKLIPVEPISRKLTDAVRRQHSGESQTLNAVCLTGNGNLLALDRNGGWVLSIDLSACRVLRWLNLYDLAGTNLREALGDFPAHRVMPYVSIEGIAVDDTHNVWLIDDPAMPEQFRASCLIRIANSLPTGTSASLPAH